MKRKRRLPEMLRRKVPDSAGGGCPGSRLQSPGDNDNYKKTP